MFGSMVGFIAVVLVTLSLNRAAAWGKRASAKHRARFLELGYKERNKPRRLRRERYIRVGVYAYFAFGLLNLMVLPSPHGRHIPAIVAIGRLVVTLLFAFFPAGVAAFLTLVVTEWTIWGGDNSLRIRDEELNPPVRPVVNNGEKGSAQKISPAEAGLTQSSSKSEKKRWAMAEEATA